jgi:hypothetical protein
MKHHQKIIIITLLVISFFSSLIINMPTWVMAWIIYIASGHRLNTSNEAGNFWHGSAMLLATDSHEKVISPLILIDWKIKFGLKNLFGVDFSSGPQALASVYYSNQALQVAKLSIDLPLSSFTPFLGNLNSLGLSGNVHVSSPLITIGKKMKGSISVHLEEVGSSISPVNPIGTYQLHLDLASTKINVTSDSNTVIKVNAAGNLSNLILKSTVVPEKKEQLIQFMTMMGVPQTDGSYQMKVF